MAQLHTMKAKAPFGLRGKMAEAIKAGDRYIVGPVLEDLLGIGLCGEFLDIATAFYSAGALSRLHGKPEYLRFMCRLDLNSPAEWQRGALNPEALLHKLRTYEDSGTEIELLVSPTAHAKAYVGSACALFGSTNLTMRGFGGSNELVVLLRETASIDKLSNTLDSYCENLTHISLDELEHYVETHRETIPDDEDQEIDDRFPSSSRSEFGRLGSYPDFLTWLEEMTNEAAIEIYDRANGKSNLQGHIHRNFYGLRQFLLANPDYRVRFQQKDPTAYSLAQDPQTEEYFATFVEKHAADEDDFELERWLTYLPEECGGRAGRHGGTIGNLNRMLPLIAKYLGSTMEEHT